MTACDECKRVHLGECLPGDVSARLCLTLPARVDRVLRERVPWGDRSRFVSELVEAALMGETNQ